MGKKIGLLVLCVFLTLALGSLGGFATVSEIGNWYSGITKPSFNPPNYLFGPVWTTLYILMGIALYTILRLPKSPQKSRMLLLFGVQMGLNVLWSFLFFKFHLIGFAAIEMSVLWIFILTMIAGLYRFNKTVGLWQIPYLLWVSFALILNWTIYALN
jgi:translocator protein